ncbi:MAG: hypothetical protein JWO94_2286 [Verrucomicrobiaceae bacterium]|nr:hypothetical protein [Verrucomicrobiaceae bacterium]
MMRFPLFAVIAALTATVKGADTAAWRHEELKRWPAAEANQGVAVDDEFFYAITNSEIGKYRKDTGQRVGGWKGEKHGSIKHLNAGLVLEGKLYCAHSNFPEIPEESSVEIWDAATMQHIGQHRFDKPPGSLTWVDQRGTEWFACFAHYKKTSDPALSRVVKMDAQWQPLATWSFPPSLVTRFAGNSSSCGAFGPGGHLFATGHDARELYVLDPPESGTELDWQGTVPITAEGQAFAWDKSQPGILYSIKRSTREVIVSRIIPGPPGTEVSSSDAPNLTALSPEEQRQGFALLFDGVHLDGWQQKGNWVIDDGALYRKDKGGPLTYTAQKVPDDFELRFEWKVTKGCNSGVYYRPGQCEYQVLDNANSPYGENPRQSAAALYSCMPPSKDATRPFGAWNESRILCKGTVIQHWLNGEKVVDFDYTDPGWAGEVEVLRKRGGDLTGRGANLWLQDHGQPVWFRHLRWRTITVGEPLATANITPMPIPAAALAKETERLDKMVKARSK